MTQCWRSCQNTSDVPGHSAPPSNSPMCGDLTSDAKDRFDPVEEEFDIALPLKLSAQSAAI